MAQQMMGGDGAGGVVGSSTSTANASSPQEVFSKDLGQWSPLEQGSRGQARLQVFLPDSKIALRKHGNGRTVIRGRVVLTLPDQTALKAIDLVFQGHSTVSWIEGQGCQEKPAYEMRQYHESKEVFSSRWHWLSGGRVHDFKAGSHSFALALDIPSNLPPSVRMPSTLSQVRYHLSVKAKRIGLHGDYSYSQEIPVVKAVPRQSQQDLWSPVDVESTWIEKILYHISIPRRAYVSGEQIKAKLRFQPLAKQIGVQSIRMILIESTTLWAKDERKDGQKVLNTVKTYYVVPGNPHSRPPKPDADNPTKEERTRASTSRHSKSSTSPPFYPHFDNYGSVQGYSEQEDFFVDASIDIPSTAHASNSVLPIVVAHKLRFQIGILNPDGHVSELGANMPIQIFDGSLKTELLEAAAAVSCLESVDRPDLPQYDSHVHDRIPLYDPGPAVGVEPIVRHREDYAVGETPLGSPGTSRPSSPILGRASQRTLSRPSSPVTRSRPSSPTQRNSQHSSRPPSPQLQASSELSSRRSSLAGHPEHIKWQPGLSRRPSVLQMTSMGEAPSADRSPLSRTTDEPARTAPHFVLDEEMLSNLAGRPTEFQRKPSSVVPGPVSNEGSPTGPSRRGSEQRSIKPSLSSRSLTDLKHFFRGGSTTVIGNNGNLTESPAGDSRSQLPSLATSGRSTSEGLPLAQRPSLSPRSRSRDEQESLTLISKVPSYELATQGWMSNDNVRSGRLSGLPSYEDVTSAEEHSSSPHRDPTTALPPESLSTSPLHTDTVSSDQTADEDLLQTMRRPTFALEQ